MSELAMINPHPPLTSFPIVLLLTTLLLECLSRWWQKVFFRKMALVLLFLGIVASGVTYISGYFGAAAANASFLVPESLIAQHQASAKFLLFLLVPTAILSLSSVIEDSSRRTCYLALLWLLNSVLLWTAYQGGQLVYSHGAGVQLESPHKRTIDESTQ